jgi:ankyrin repeat protein
MTRLGTLATKGDLSGVRSELARGTKVDVRDTRLRGHRTPLMHAARAGHIAVVEALLDGGADPNALNIYGGSALTHCIYDGGQPNIAKLLLRRGANVDLKASLSMKTSLCPGQTALMIAVEEGASALVALFLKHGANPNERDFYGRTALACAAASHLASAKDVSRLLDAGATIDAKTLPKMIAEAKRSNPDVASVLLEHERKKTRRAR